MFDLEQTIAEWRRQMLAAGIKSPVPLEELESHLREKIEQLKQSGADERMAFEKAVQQTGSPRMLKNEFNKVEAPFMQTIFKSVTVLLIGIMAQLPGSLQLRDELVISDKWLGLWLLGLVLQMGSLELLRRIIQPKFTGRELRKVEWSFPKANLKSGAGLAVLLAGGALMIPATTQSVRDGLVTFEALCWLVFGISLLIASLGVMCFPYQRRAA